MTPKGKEKGKMNKDYEVIRAELWKEVYVAYVSASNSTRADYGKNWADDALAEFDKRFKERLETQKEQ